MHHHLKAWLKVPLDEISKGDCVASHSRIASVGERGANHVLKSFRSIYNHARRTHDLPECPTIAIEWLAEPPSRRIIEDLDEGKRVVDSLENPIHTAYYRLLGGVRPIRTRLCKDSEAVPNAAPRSRHSARAAARLSLKLSLL